VDEKHIFIKCIKCSKCDKHNKKHSKEHDEIPKKQSQNHDDDKPTKKKDSNTSVKKKHVKEHDDEADNNDVMEIIKDKEKDNTKDKVKTSKQAEQIKGAFHTILDNIKSLFVDMEKIQHVKKNKTENKKKHSNKNKKTKKKEDDDISRYVIVFVGIIMLALIAYKYSCSFHDYVDRLLE
jgi:hypothetical protein